ncbi:tannase/feruloyl esterase family alpha/beta hydrolase [Alteromonas confluentis]|uniref:Tannase n=1 Tax=Alteromonas confluentis TaxID=1656094 RepID=A0A1E7ZA13_9ALTE|nr:tannase/feruloyl esterase family alpha/beta hydrolase [Alteromonas confluentis]OFC70317.1 hypothetical protein BFC18_14175 [Alteromonas confluentis]
MFHRYKTPLVAACIAIFSVFLSACGQQATDKKPEAKSELPAADSTSSLNSPLSLNIVTPVASCENLLTFDLTKVGGEGSKITSASEQTVNGKTTCVVEGTMAPTVGFKVTLPKASWTQRFMQLGCGGLCGMINMNIGAADGCKAVESDGFALASTDMGHKGMGGSFGQNPQKRIDFAYRGVHITALASKALIKEYYGQPAKYAYFNGCSDGGREALVEAQRYPDDFDGIIAGAPAMNFSVQNSFFHGWQARSNTGADGNAILHAADMPILYNAAVAACDEQDGLKDGIISQPFQCDFDPQVTLCKEGDSENCLTQGKIDAAKKLYDGPKDPSTGKALTLGGPQPGSELSWVGVYVPRAGSEQIFSTMIADGATKNLIYQQNPPANYTLDDFQFTENNFNNIRPLNGLYSGTNPDINAFRERGGKLIIWHGLQDPHISPVNTVTYYEAAKKASSGGKDVSDFMQLYLFPGMYHCDGGTGPHDFDLLTPMMAWVEQGIKPEAIIASHDGTAGNQHAGPPRKDDEQKAPAIMGSPDGKAATVVDVDYVKRSWPVYPYPTVAAYTGEGDWRVAANYKPVSGPSMPSYDWAGNRFFKPDSQLNCSVIEGSFRCEKAAH